MAISAFFPMTMSVSKQSPTRRHSLDQKILKEIEKLKKILEADPYNLNRRFDIKKPKGIKPGAGQFRIRIKPYRLHYDIFGPDGNCLAL